MFRILKPARVYVTEDVYEDAAATARVERMMDSIEPDEPLQRVSYEELNDLAPRLWANFPRWGEIENPRDPDLVFTTGKFWSDEERQSFIERYPHLRIRDLAGFTVKQWRPDGEIPWREEHRGIVCQSAWQLHSIMGCPFRCAYCGLGGLNRILVNVEEYMSHLDEIVTLQPEQRLYKWDNITDVSAFEPELGHSKMLVEYFAHKPGKYLEIYVGKSNNIDYLLDLDHHGKTILQWSLSPRTQSTIIEPETAPWNERVEAARRCQEAGYIVRFRFSPIIPVKGWQDEYAELVDLIFARTQPDVISLCAFGWMNLEAARRCLDFDLLDPHFVAAMEAAAPFLAVRGFSGGGGHPIPHDARAYLFKVIIDQIRRHHPTIPIALCLETIEMWTLFERELGMRVNPYKKSNYYCNCGPLCTPEHPLSKGVAPGKSWFADVPATL